MILVRDVAGNDAGLQVRQRLWRSLEQRHVGCRRERLRVGGGIGRQEAVTRWRGKTFTRRPAGYDATNVAQAPSVQCGAKRRRRKVVVILGRMFGWEAAGVAHRRVCASGYPGSPCGTASFWNPLLWWGGVKARFPLSLADPTAGGRPCLVSREQGSNPNLLAKYCDTVYPTT